MSNKSIDGLTIQLIVYVVLGVIAVTFTVSQPYFEAATYNKLVCPDVPATYVDAVFAKLRVMESNCATPNTNINN